MNADDLATIQREALAAFAGASTLDSLKDAEVACLGKKAPLTLLNQTLGKLDPEARKRTGAGHSPSCQITR